ncbi:MAG: peptide ABC transporter substrate-binding protein [Phycisphaerae bacterium]
MTPLPSGRRGRWTPLCMLLALVAAAAGVARLTPGDARADLRLVDSVSIATLDPAQISWLQDIRVIAQLYEGLCAYDRAGNGIVPGCAERLVDPSDDPRRAWRFRIRADARWSNGDAVSADDFLFAWRRAIEPGTARDYAFFFDAVRGVRDYVAWRGREIERLARLPAGERADAVARHLREADARFATVGLRCLDAHTLQIDLERPVAYLPALLACPVFLPLHRATVEPFGRVGESGTIFYDPQWCKPGRTCYNGPFALADWRFKRGLRLSANPAYRDAASVHLRSVEWIDVADATTAWLMYDTGAVDWILSLEAPFVPALLAGQSPPRRDIHAFPALGTYFYNFNCAARLPDGRANPLHDPLVRRAIAQAIDRAALVQHVTRRGEPPATTLVPPGLIARYPAVAGLPFDPDGARRALAQAGWPGGRGFPEVSLLFSNEADHGLIAQSVAAMLAQHLGITVRLIGKEAQTYRADKERHEFMLARASWYGDYADPTSFLDVFRSDSGNNDSDYRDADYDRRLRAADDLADPAARLAALAEVERVLVTDAVPLLPLFHYVNVYAYNPDALAGVRLDPRLVPALATVEIRR